MSATAIPAGASAPGFVSGPGRELAGGLVAAGVALVVWTVPTGLSTDARIAIAVFAACVIGWVVSRLGDSVIALAGAAVLVATGVMRPDELYGALGNELIWLLVASFVLAAVLKASGLANRAAFACLRRVTSLRALFHGLALFIAATALVIPSTSGRAALLLPIFLALSDLIDDRPVTRALALLFPTAVLLSAGGSLLGAGAHLVAVDFIARAGGERIGYVEWLALGMPLALLLTHAAAEIVLRAFVTRDRRARAIDLTGAPRHAGKPRSLALIAILAVTVGLWLTAPLHGFGPGFVAIAGAIAATLPGVSTVSLKQGVKAVEWDLLIFMAATLMLGEALLSTNAEEWAARRLLIGLSGSPFTEPMVLLPLVIAIALVAHLVITSRTARATVLIPALALPLAGLGLDPTAATLAIVMGTGFCQTFAASAKPVALYADLDRETYTGADLLRLSLLLLPVAFVAITMVALVVWPMQGIPTSR